MVGCGSGGSGSASATPAPGGGTGSGGAAAPAPILATAAFHVDVSTGTVNVVAQNGAGGASGPAADPGHILPVAFGGTTLSFTSSLLLDQPGDVGAKALDVALTNHFGVPLGVDAAGNASPIRVLFGPIVNGFPDIRPRTVVGTLAGAGVSGSADGPAASATFSGPYGTAADGQGTVYVADYTNNKIRKISGGGVSTLAGSGAATSVDGLGAAATFHNPSGLAINPVDGALIVCDYLGQKVRRVTPAGAVTTIAGTGAVGAGNGTGAVATFNGPIAAAVDGAGNIYVSDRNGYRIRKIAFSGGDPALPASYAVATLAGSGTSAVTDGVGVGASFNGPYGIALGGNSDLYVCDTGGQRIRRVGFDGSVTTVAGKAMVGSTDGTGDLATFSYPTGIAFANGALFIVENSGNRLRQMSLVPGGSVAQAASWNVRALAGTGAAGAADGAGNVATFNMPRLVSADGAGNLFVADYSSNKIRVVSPANGSFPIGVPGGSVPTTPVLLSNATGYIPQSALGTNLPYVTYAGNLAPGAQTAANTWAFVVPSGVTAFDFQVSVEASTGVLQPPGLTNTLVRTLSGVDDANSQGDQDGPATEARYYFLRYVSVDRAGNAFLTDINNRKLKRMSPDGFVTTIVGPNASPGGDGPGNTATIGLPCGVAASADGTQVFFTDQDMVKVAILSPGSDPRDAGNWTISTLAGSTTGFTDGLGSAALFNGLDGLALDPGGRTLYITEVTANRIRKMTFLGGDPKVKTNWLVSTLAGQDFGTSSPGTFANGFASTARFNTPRGIAADHVGNIYVADTGNARVRKIAPDGFTSTLTGSGSAGFFDGDASTTQFNALNGLAVDSSGYVYVTDVVNFDVRRIDPAGNTTTLAGVLMSSGTNDGPGGAAKFLFPRGLAVTGAGDIYLADENAVRLLQKVVNVGTD